MVVAALVEHGGHGGSAAAPVVQRVLAAYFDVPLISPSVAPPAPAGAPREVEAGAPPQEETRLAEAPEAEDAGD